VLHHHPPEVFDRRRHRVLRTGESQRFMNQFQVQRQYSYEKTLFLNWQSLA
jgi:hypothetical protein